MFLAESGDAVRAYVFSMAGATMLPERDMLSDAGLGCDRPQVSRTRQFGAIMYKNLLLQFRSRKVVLGFRLGGAAGVLFEVLIPVLFISAMCLLQRFPKLTYPPLVFKAYDLHDSQWSRQYTGADIEAREPNRCRDATADRKRFPALRYRCMPHVLWRFHWNIIRESFRFRSCVQ